MKHQNEKLRCLSQKEKRQARYSLFLLTKSQKRIPDEIKYIPPPKKIIDTFTIVEFPTDYNIKEIKAIKMIQQQQQQPPNMSSNGNIFGCDNKYNNNYYYHNQGYINSTIYKIDKDILLSNPNNNNHNNTNHDISSKNPESDLIIEGQTNKLLSNFLQIKAVRLTNQLSCPKKLNQFTKNILPYIGPSEKDKKLTKKPESEGFDLIDESKKGKNSIRTFSSMKPSSTPYNQGLYFAYLDPLIHSLNKEINQDQNHHHQNQLSHHYQHQHFPYNQRQSDSGDIINEFQQKNSQESTIPTLVNGETSYPNNANNDRIIKNSSQQESKNCSNLRNYSSASPKRYGNLRIVKSDSSNSQLQRPNLLNLQKINSSIPLSQSAANISSSNLNMNSQNGNINGVTIGLSQSNVMINQRSSRYEWQQQQKQITGGVLFQEERKKVPLVYKYYVGPGNNGDLVKRVMNKRDSWEECEQSYMLFNFKWQQSNRGYKYEKLIQNQNNRQLVNHFENHKEISTKNMLIKNLSAYCEQNKMTLFDITPTTFILDMDDEQNFEHDMQRFAKFFIKHHPDSNKYSKPEGLKNPNIVYNFDFKKKKNNVNQLPLDKKISPYLKPKMHKSFNKGFGIWLLKPTGYNRGRGIEVFNTLEALNVYINEYFDGFVEVGPNQRRSRKNDPEGGGNESEESDVEDKKKLQGPVIKSHTFVLQKYIESPLLINQRKFDIRIWAMVTHEMNLYFFKEGYLRLSSEIFTLNEENIDNKFIHLTNNAVQKYSENYGQYENGNQLSFAGFEKYMLDNNMNGDFKGKILPRMKELVSISMNSVKKTLNLYERKYCMEIFGFDFFLDSDFNVWLIEVNTNPCIEESSPILEMYLPRMLDDGFKLTLDVLFPQILKKPLQQGVINNGNQSIQEGNKLLQNEGLSPKAREYLNNTSPDIVNNEIKERIYHVDGYKDDENMW